MDRLGHTTTAPTGGWNLGKRLAMLKIAFICRFRPKHVAGLRALDELGHPSWPPVTREPANQETVDHNLCWLLNKLCTVDVAHTAAQLRTEHHACHGAIAHLLADTVEWWGIISEHTMVHFPPAIEKKLVQCKFQDDEEVEDLHDWLLRRSGIAVNPAVLDITQMKVSMPVDDPRPTTLLEEDDLHGKEYMEDEYDDLDSLDHLRNLTNKDSLDDFPRRRTTITTPCRPVATRSKTMPSKTPQAPSTTKSSLLPDTTSPESPWLAQLRGTRRLFSQDATSQLRSTRPLFSHNNMAPSVPSSPSAGLRNPGTRRLRTAHVTQAMSPASPPATPGNSSSPHSQQSRVVQDVKDATEDFFAQCGTPGRSAVNWTKIKTSTSAARKLMQKTLGDDKDDDDNNDKDNNDDNDNDKDNNNDYHDFDDYYNNDNDYDDYE